MKVGEASLLMGANATGASPELFDKEIKDFSIDSRSVGAGELFFALSQEDYARAGFSIHKSGEATGRQIIFYCCALIPISILPTFFGLTGMIYLSGAVLLGFVYLGYGFAVALFRSNTHAHRLLRVSVLYLPALLVLMMIDKL